MISIEKEFGYKTEIRFGNKPEINCTYIAVDYSYHVSNTKYSF